MTPSSKASLDALLTTLAGPLGLVGSSRPVNGNSNHSGGPSAALAAASQYIANDLRQDTNVSDVSLGVSNTSEEAAAHTLNRLLVTAIIVPLVHDPKQDNQSLQTGLRLRQALETLDKSVTLFPKFLEHLFEVSPTIAHDNLSTFPYCNTTFDVWATPRLLSASASILAAAQYEAVAEERTRMLDQASHILATSVRILSASIDTANQVDNVRLVLLESIRASVLALSLTGQTAFAAHIRLPDILVPKQIRRNQDDTDLSATFFASEVAAPYRLNSRKDRPKPSGRSPAAFSSEQNSSCFDYPLQVTSDARISVADRASALLCSAFDMTLRLAANQPSALLDVAELAMRTFAENVDHLWTRQKQLALNLLLILPWSSYRLRIIALHTQYISQLHRPRLLQILQIAIDQLSGLLEASEEDLAALEKHTESLSATHELLQACNRSIPIEERHILSPILRPYLSEYVREIDTLTASDSACDKAQLARIRCSINALTLGVESGASASSNAINSSLSRQIMDMIVVPVHQHSEGADKPTWYYPQTQADLNDLTALQSILDSPKRALITESRPMKRRRRSLSAMSKNSRHEKRTLSHRSSSDTIREAFTNLGDRAFSTRHDDNHAKLNGDAVKKELELRRHAYTLCKDNMISPREDRDEVFRPMICKCSRSVTNSDLRCGRKHNEKDFALDTPLLNLLSVTSQPSALTPQMVDIVIRLVNHTPVNEPLAIGDDSLVLRLITMGLRAKSRQVRLLVNELAFSTQERFLEQQKLAGEEHGVRRLQILPQTYSDVLGTTNFAKWHETAILGLARLSTLPTEACQESCLLTLVLQIGNANPFIKANAYYQIVQLAAEQKCTTFQLLRPHLKVISITIVERFISTPDLWTGFLSLIKMNSAAFFNATIEYTLPYLITLICIGRAEVGTRMIQLIARALGSDVPQLCLQNITPIFRSFFMHTAQLRNQGLEKLVDLIGVDAVNLKVLLRSRQSEIVGYLVIQLGNTATSKEAYEGLIYFVDTLTGSDVQANGLISDSSKGKTAEFLEKEILPILAHINHDLAGDHGRRTNADRANAIRSIGALVPIIGMPITAVTPQIMATLNSNLQVDALMLAVLQSWKEFIRTFKFDDIGPIVGQTAAALQSVWDRFNKEQEKVAINILRYLILENASYLKNAKSLKDHIDDIPSLERLRDKIPDICKALRELRERWSQDKLFRNILDRTAHENVSISHESLKELQTFLVEERTYIEGLTSGDTFSPLIGQCVRTLMQVVAKGDTQQQETRDITYRCFGLVGAVDPDRIEHAIDDPLKIVLNNFEDQDEAIDFALHLIQDLLVPAFRAADDTTHQSRLAYAIQELLKIVGFSSAMVGTSSYLRPVSIKSRQRLNSMSRDVVNTITPLLDSKYMVQVGTVTPKDTPIYRHTQSYRDWLQGWANALIIKAMERHETQRTNLSGNRAAETASTIFGVFRIAIRDHDTGIARHLLPHLVLHSIISGDGRDRENIIEEVQTILTDQVEPDTGYDEERRLLTAQTLFTVMDHIGVWMRRKRQDLAKSSRRPRNMLGGEDALAEVELAMKLISQELMAQASLKCKTYSRALLNFESRVRSMRTEGKTDTDMQPYYENLHRIYAQLDEPDGMEGISTRVISPSLEHQIREHESTGRWTSAQSCWEVELQQRPNDPDLHLGLLRCLRNLGHYDTMRTHIRGALSSHPEWEMLLDSFRVEGACILGDWSEVESRTSDPHVKSAEHSIGRALLAMRKPHDAAFQTALTEARQDMGKSLIAAGKTSYPSIYDAVLNLHMLHEIELIRSDVAGTARRSTRASVDDLNRSLAARLNATLPSFRTQEPLLSLRRTALSAMPSGSVPNSEVGQAWISTAKIARRAGHTQTAYSATLQATQHKASFAFVQRVKLLAREEQTHAAIQDLSNSLNTLKSTFKEPRPSKGPLIELQQLDTTGRPMSINRTSYAKACLLRARLLDSTFRYTSAEILEKYRDAKGEQSDSEKAWYYLGHFQDSHETLLPDFAQRHNVCKSFLKSAVLGTKYFYRTLPRVVTIWMDIAADEQIMAARKGAGNDATLANKLDAFKNINKLVKRSSESIKPFQWFAVFPQLVARIVQKNEDAWIVLLEIVVQVLSAYPQQAMWSMVAGSHSKDPERKRRYSEIVSRINGKAGTNQRDQRDVIKVIHAAQRLARELLRMCDYEVPRHESTLSMKKLFPGLLEIANVSGLLLPLQSSMTVLLPANHVISDQHRPFPSDLPMIHSFEDTIEVMNSLQKPRKVMIVGSDSTRYPFLVKPKDDLRKDARLMEFDSMINKLLQSQPEARKRKLYVRTYAVLILNEEHGLIEWVPNTIGLRHILLKLYNARDINMYGGEIKTLMEEARLSPDPKTTEQIFRDKILTRYPPVFYEWFLATFPDPTAWLKARSAYARTAAVMSMVGFVLGLGDRHGENILFDSVSGDTVHVDLNCLFDRGQRFEIAERVPFRLTQNMVDAMGVTGYDGAFRKSAEITMGILRANKESLMSVLEAMVHDPLGEWGAPDDRQRARNTSIRQDPRVAEARRALDPVAHKLDGRIYRLGVRDPTPPYATNNLVDALIKEATSSVNLAKMYVGWSSWL